MASVTRMVTQAGETLWVRRIKGAVTLSLGNPGRYKHVVTLTRDEAMQLSHTFFDALPPKKTEGELK